MRDPVRRKLISRYPHRDIRLPKLADDERQFLTADQIHTVSNALDLYRGMGLLGGFGGLRLGEVIALRGEEVSHGAVRVRRTAYKLPGGVQVGAPRPGKQRAQ